jgi:UDP-N-acetylglucosamine--N-acetylmuramyl-(pentapeptide) pyrophosphoryl-undecaprenol N-acetylglucosamine transferase
MTNKEQKLIVLAAGGTGGHLFPAEALAQELLNRGHRVVIITDKRGAAFQKLGDRVQIDCVRAAYLKAGLVNKIKALLDIGIGVLQSAILLHQYKPDRIVGFGGFSSFPAMLAGQLMGYSTMLHEQNAVLGKANIQLIKFAKKIAASLPATRGIEPRYQSKVVVTGNPVRADICALREQGFTAPELSEKFVILITGGSQAARVFGGIVPAALALLPEAFKQRLHIIHQCPAADIEATCKKYRDAGISAEVKAFFSDMAERLAACHLFIGRSGASTVAEIAVVGRPAIFVPYPTHADQQQKYNAELIAQQGGAVVMLEPDFTPEALAPVIAELVGSSEKLETMAQAAKHCGLPDAVRHLADVTLADL